MGSTVCTGCPLAPDQWRLSVGLLTLVTNGSGSTLLQLLPTLFATMTTGRIIVIVWFFPISSTATSTVPVSWILISSPLTLICIVWMAFLAHSTWCTFIRGGTGRGGRPLSVVGGHRSILLPTTLFLIVSMVIPAHGTF